MSQLNSTEPQSNAGPSWDELFLFNPTSQPFEPFQNNTQYPDGSTTNVLNGQAEPLAMEQDLLMSNASFAGFNYPETSMCQPSYSFQAQAQSGNPVLSKLNDDLAKVYLTIWELKIQYEQKFCTMER
jgi:hypothetical protein